MKAILFISSLALSLGACAQQNAIDLEGEWTAINADSAYYKNNDIEFHQDINYYVKAKQCYYVYWRVLNKTDLQIENHFVCTEPGRVTRSQEKETFKLNKKGGTQEIEIQRGGKTVEKFKVVEYKEVKIDSYPYDTKILRVQRIKK
jgi:lipoprotein-anchoring transpeptidase ErfK/SrfK